MRSNNSLDRSVVILVITLVINNLETNIFIENILHLLYLQLFVSFIISEVLKTKI